MRIVKNESLKIRSFALYNLFSMILIFYGCSRVTPPADYYQEVLDMEENGEQSRSETGRRPEEVITPVKETEPIRTAESSEHQLIQDESQPQAVEPPSVEDKEIEEEPPRREPVKESPPIKTEPIAVSADVIKNALNAPEVNVGARTVELINGRLSGGKNSVRISFISESVDEIGNAFATICAVIYYINEESNTIDVIEGIAEDQQSALLAILRSNISDVAEWMNQKATKLEWYSKVTKKIL